MWAQWCMNVCALVHCVSMCVLGNMYVCAYCGCMLIMYTHNTPWQEAHLTYTNSKRIHNDPTQTKDTWFWAACVLTPHVNSNACGVMFPRSSCIFKWIMYHMQLNVWSVDVRHVTFLAPDKQTSEGLIIAMNKSEYSFQLYYPIKHHVTNHISYLIYSLCIISYPSGAALFMCLLCCSLS